MIKKYKEYLANVCLGIAAILTAIDKFIFDLKNLYSLEDILLFVGIFLIIDSSNKNLFWKIIHYMFLFISVAGLIWCIMRITGITEPVKEL